jgi:hypothetical protein
MADPAHPWLKRLTSMVSHDNFCIILDVGMADDGFDGRPYRDTVSVRGVVVMPGESWPAEFYSRFPEAFRLPVRITWRDGSAEKGAAPHRHSSPIRKTPVPGGVAGAAAEDLPKDNGASGDPVTAPPMGAWHGGEAVGSFLRVNDFLDRLMGSAAPPTRSTCIKLAVAGDLSHGAGSDISSIV